MPLACKDLSDLLMRERAIVGSSLISIRTNPKWRRDMVNISRSHCRTRGPTVFSMMIFWRDSSVWPPSEYRMTVDCIAEFYTLLFY
jgi:hypothetical protein